MEIALQVHEDGRVRLHDDDIQKIVGGVAPYQLDIGYAAEMLVWRSLRYPEEKIIIKNGQIIIGDTTIGVKCALLSVSDWQTAVLL